MRIHTDPFYLTIQETIKKHDRQVLAIGPEGKLPPFFYTIGNHLKNLPELLLIGPWKADLGTLALNKLSEQMIEMGHGFKNGELANIGGEHSMQVWDTTVIAKLQYTLQCTEYFGDQNYLVQQVVMPDPKGRYPGDKRLHKRYRVPVLRATAAIMQSMRVH
jgi:hypothetical protein